MYSPSLGAPASPQRRGSALRFGLVDEATELDEDEDEDDLPLPQRQRRGGNRQEVLTLSSDDEDHRGDTGGLISWEDFASELEALAPPPASMQKGTGRSFATSTPPPVPFRNPARQQQQQQHANSSSPFPSTGSKRPSLDVSRSGGSSVATPSGKSLRGKLSLATLRR
jgi:hypothetical protein